MKVWTIIAQVLFVTFAVSLPYSNAQATYALPSSRAIVWHGNVGVENDIPARTDLCASLRPSGADDTLAIQNAINSCAEGKVVKLSAGTFRVTPPLQLGKGITLRGAGMGTTILKGTGTSSNYFVRIGSAGAPDRYITTNVAGSLGKGQTTITTETDHGFEVGDLIVIDQLNDSESIPPVNNVGSNNSACTWCGRERGSRSFGQVAKIKSVPTSRTLVVEIPFYANYNGSLNPQVTKILETVEAAGVENLTIDNLLSGNADQAGDNGTVLMQATSNSWLLNVEILGSHQTGLRIFAASTGRLRNRSAPQSPSARFMENWGIPLRRRTSGAQGRSGRRGQY